jgi:hypothetical protein
MGASFDSRTFLTDDKGIIRNKWEEAVEYSKIMDGCSYSGSIGMFDASIDWVRREPFNTANEAYEYISEQHSKWDGPMAVSFKIQGGKAVPAYVKNAIEKYEQATAKKEELVISIRKAIFNAKSKFIGCKVCGSKINRSFIKDTSCPICNKATLISATDEKRIARANTKIEKTRFALQQARQKANKQNANGKIGYVVGGWVAI